MKVDGHLEDVLMEVDGRQTKKWHNLLDGIIRSHCGIPLNKNTENIIYFQNMTVDPTKD